MTNSEDAWKYEVLANCKFAVDFDGLQNLFVKSVSGIKTILKVQGDKKPVGVTKGMKTLMQATVTNVQNSPITIVYMANREDRQLVDWYDSCHAKPQFGGGTKGGGARKDGSIKIYTQEGKEAARWNIFGAMCLSYECSPMEAGGDQLITETIQIAYEKMVRVKPGS